MTHDPTPSGRDTVPSVLSSSTGRDAACHAIAPTGQRQVPGVRSGIEDNAPPANATHIRRLWIPPLIWIAAIFSASCWSGPDVELPFWFEGLDKIIHLIIYSVLAQFFFMPLRFERGASLRTAAIAACLLTTLYGITDEWHQSFTPGRSVEGLDVWADFLGGCTALLTAYYLHKRNGVELWIRQRLMPVSKNSKS